MFVQVTGKDQEVTIGFRNIEVIGQLDKSCSVKWWDHNTNRSVDSLGNGWRGNGDIKS